MVTAKLGERTDTSDAEGQVVQSREVNVAEADILAALSAFRGEILQVPTMFSALKHNGRPLYEYARAGITVEREARPITIFELKFIDYQAPFLTLEVHCSKGTYIRTLVDDLGEALGCGAHVTMLRRLAVADYPIGEMMPIEDLALLADSFPNSELDRLLLPMDTAVASLPQLNLTAKQTKAVGFGQRVKFENPQALSGLVRLFSENGQFLGIAEITAGNIIRPNRMVNL